MQESQMKIYSVNGDKKDFIKSALFSGLLLVIWQQVDLMENLGSHFSSKCIHDALFHKFHHICILFVGLKEFLPLHLSSLKLILFKLRNQLLSSRNMFLNKAGGEVCLGYFNPKVQITLTLKHKFVGQLNVMSPDQFYNQLELEIQPQYSLKGPNS